MAGVGLLGVEGCHQHLGCHMTEGLTLFSVNPNRKTRIHGETVEENRFLPAPDRTLGHSRNRKK
jgi:hypothetical protein